MAPMLNPALAPLDPTSIAVDGRDSSTFASPEDAPAVAYNPNIMPDWQRDGSKPAYPISERGVPMAVRRARYPELHQLRLPISLVEMWREARAVPRSVDHHARDLLFEDGDAPGKFVVAWHGWLNRLALFELVRNPKVGPAYQMVTIFQTEPMPGMLPADLDHFHHRHLKGCIGQIRIPDRRDFELIRETSRRRPIEEIEEAFDREQVATAAAIEYKQDQEREEAHDYIWNAVHDAANGATVKLVNGRIVVEGAKQRSFPGESQYYHPRRNPERWARHAVKGQRGHISVWMKRGSRADQEYTQQESRALDRELEQKEQQRAQAELQRRARASVGLPTAGRGRTL